MVPFPVGGHTLWHPCNDPYIESLSKDSFERENQINGEGQGKDDSQELN